MSGPTVPNITAPGAARRRRAGVVWLAAGTAAAVVLRVRGAPDAGYAALVIPFGLAMLGLLQARERTCVVLGALGKRESGLEQTGPWTPEARLCAQAQAVRVAAWSSLGGVALAGLAWLAARTMG